MWDEVLCEVIIQKGSLITEIDLLAMGDAYEIDTT